MRHPNLKCMLAAIGTSRKCKAHEEANPRVGAVAVLRDGSQYSAYRGEVVQSYRGTQSAGDHAEFTLVHKKIGSAARLEGATLYTTLEPCTERTHNKLCCADWIIQKKVSHVVVGMLDPNPVICGKGYWRLIDAGVRVDMFPFDLADQTFSLNERFVKHFRADTRLGLDFPRLLRKSQSARISPYHSFGFGDTLELLSSPNLREGWPLAQVILKNNDRRGFALPKEWKVNYKQYFQRKYDEKRFYDDGEKFMLTGNPIAWSEAPTLVLETRPTRYSVQHFYRDEIATRNDEANALINKLVTDPLEACFG